MLGILSCASQATAILLAKLPYTSAASTAIRKIHPKILVNNPTLAAAVAAALLKIERAILIPYLTA
ncbi:hypothetical protein SPAR61_1864 [Streptococcus pneumoniae GA19998]|nr:hypothetical protein SPAR61_1864 [Streptococcus pneumoniae GA19998]